MLYLPLTMRALSTSVRPYERNSPPECIFGQTRTSICGERKFSFRAEPFLVDRIVSAVLDDVLERETHRIPPFGIIGRQTDRVKARAVDGPHSLEVLRLRAHDPKNDDIILGERVHLSLFQR